MSAGNIAAGCMVALLGAVVGGVLGVLLGGLYTRVGDTSCFEGYCAMLVFYSFMPVGAILGAVVTPLAMRRLRRRSGA